MSEPIKKTDLSSISQAQRNHLFQQQHIHEQQHQNQYYTAQYYNPSSSSYYHTHQQNPNYPYYHPNGYPQQLPENGFMPEPAPNYQNTPAQSHGSGYNVGQHNPNYQPKGYPQQLPENGFLPEPEPNYQNIPAPGQGSGYNVGQHNPKGYTKQLPEPAPNYHNTPAPGQGSVYNVGQQNPYYLPKEYQQQLPKNGSLPEPAPNYQNAPAQGQGSGYNVGQQNSNYQPKGYRQQLSENGPLPEPAPNYQNAPAQGQERGYNSGQHGGHIGDLGNTGYLTPAAKEAVAALSELVQFAGSMEGATWTGQRQQAQFAGSVNAAQPAYISSGGRGSWSFRGRSPGRGRGRISFSHVSHNSASSSSNPNSSADVATKPIEVNQEEQKPETANPNKPLPRAFRCELCRIECNSLDILEQHKNGKKHKKNVEKARQLPPVAVTTESEYVAEKTLGENATTESDRGTKRKMIGGQNGKITCRVNEGPKVVIPKICDLCYVKCDTQEVFNRHLAGKKHMMKLKRYEDHQSMYGADGLQALYPPMLQTLLQQQGPQQLCPVPREPFPQPEANLPPQHHYAAKPLPTGVESTVPGPGS